MITLYIDKQEKLPLTFTSPLISAVKRVSLPYGDYAAVVYGKKCTKIFERKSKQDLWGTLGGNPTNHRRFKNEIERAKKDNVELILITECSQTNILKGCTYKKKGKFVDLKMNGLAMLRKINTFQDKYGLRYVFCNNREEMATHITEEFFSWGKLNG